MQVVSRRHSQMRFSMAIASAILASTAMVSGCANYSKKHFTVGSVPDDYRSRHPIVISEQEETLDIPVASGAYRIPQAVKSAISGFAAEFNRSAAGSIQVLVPSGSVNENAAVHISREVVAVISSAGVSSRRISVVSYFAGQEGAAAPIRLSYAAIKAKVDGCGQWPDDLTNTTENRQYHNFGCASQNNLSQIVANPSDLLGPRGSTEIDAARRSEVVSKWRKGEITATETDE